MAAAHPTLAKFFRNLAKVGWAAAGQPPVSAPVQTGSAATAVTRQLDLEARAEAADALRRVPGIMK
eukprot:COSAG03_NODE_2048_length_3185_cov_42.169151_4_plen_66_part_00